MIKKTVRKTQPQNHNCNAKQTQITHRAKGAKGDVPRAADEWGVVRSGIRRKEEGGRRKEEEGGWAALRLLGSIPSQN